MKSAWREWHQASGHAYPHGDYTPADPGPLMGTANQTSFSPKAIGPVTWDPSDAGVDRVAPIDIGAFQR